MLKKLNVFFILLLLACSCSDDNDDVTACAVPNAISTSSITMSSAIISWGNSNASESYRLEYGNSGFALGSGTTVSTTTTSIELTNLIGNTTYDVYVQRLCSESNVSMYSDVLSFTTSAILCQEVSNLSLSLISDTSLFVAWEDTINADVSYDLEVGISGFNTGSGTALSTSETSLLITDLLPLTTYDIYIKSSCSQGIANSTAVMASFTTLAIPVIPEFRPTLSELNLFSGALENLAITPYGFEYDLHSKLFTDYATKQRFFVLPTGEKLTYNGEGLPIFPDNSIIVKTFFYNTDDRDLSLGRKIIETRLLIKINGSWETGDYKWNDAQTEAVLDLNGSIVPVTWIDADGESNSVNYEIPSNTDCFTCHQTNSIMTPIGPKMRSINFDFNGSNQIQQLIENELLEGLTNPANVSLLPNWQDASISLSRRARAYMDVNCAHCHKDEGSCAVESDLRLEYETPFELSDIQESQSSILARIQNTIPQYGMPLIGTTILNDEAVSVMIEYIESLE
ncbi:fibronectin type III domain-containing protein [Psychroserpens sp.]|uniref:fibronectin type III domain-containing protein n=1 Tax=Psychroserpens sp. TaxID=2020870 RepID=UPI003C75518B